MQGGPCAYHQYLVEKWWDTVGQQWNIRLPLEVGKAQCSKHFVKCVVVKSVYLTNSDSI